MSSNNAEEEEEEEEEEKEAELEANNDVTNALAVHTTTITRRIWINMVAGKSALHTVHKGDDACTSRATTNFGGRTKRQKKKNNNNNK